MTAKSNQKNIFLQNNLDTLVSRTPSNLALDIAIYTGLYLRHKGLILGSSSNWHMALYKINLCLKLCMMFSLCHLIWASQSSFDDFFFAKMGSAFVQLFHILSHFSARDFASLQLVSPPMMVGAINVSQSQKTFVFEASSLSLSSWHAERKAQK